MCPVFEKATLQPKLSLLAIEIVVHAYQSINQSRFYFFVHYTADNHIKMHTCGRKKGISDKTIYVETCAN